MSDTSNPFARGYQNLRSVRTVCITITDQNPHVRRPIHTTQAHLSDEDLMRSPCVFSDDFALVTHAQDPNDALLGQCRSGNGIVHSVTYAIYGDDFDGTPVHLGDSTSAQAAQKTVQRLSFETGIYSRCWEISASHLTTETWNYLFRLAGIATPNDFLFLAFRIPDSPAVGVKLFATPWTDANLQLTDGLTTSQLLQQYRDNGLPADLTDVLGLAGEADVRILIFDEDANELTGLKVYET